ncbi:uncharacterized protein LOC134823448 isoform X2 [Bolinopsis microptera]|uniref:uncharacterized protein LOC134823448 isoform X2 n=1 Tax=Bolinopsis microptera TaxID=2820187 RepID=UPI0030797185
MEDSDILDHPAAMTIELDRWQFERRLHHYVEYQYWEKLQRLRVSSGKPTNDKTRRSSIIDSQQRPRSQPALRRVKSPNTEISDKAFLRKVSAKPGNCAPSIKSSATSSTTNCPSTKSVTFMLPRGGEVSDHESTESEPTPPFPFSGTKAKKT